MSEHSNDCYLCGAHNDADASFCKRCNGQLLKLESSSPEPELDAISDEPDEAPVEQPSSGNGPKSKTRGIRRGSTLEDSRLSDALGLGDAEPDNLELLNTEVRSVPKAKVASGMPMLGSRASSQRSLRQEAPEKRTWILLGLLLLVTTWVGWNALRPTSPDSLAFTQDAVAAPTTSTSSTTTTTTPPRLWSASEVTGTYGDAFVIVQLTECSATETATAQSVGINVDRFTTLIDTSPLPGADVAQVFSLRGAARGGAVLGTSDNGAPIAVFPVPRGRDIRIDAQDPGEAHFFLHLDENNLLAPVADSNVPGRTQVAVSAQGELVNIRINGQTLTAAEVSDAVDTVELREGETVSTDPCSWPGSFEFANAVSNNTNTDQTTSEDETEKVEE